MSSPFNTRVYLLLVAQRAALALLFALPLTGCLPQEVVIPVHRGLAPQLQGRFEEGRYYDWKGMFSIKMNKCEQQYILEDFVPGYGTSTVAFRSLCDELRFVRVDNVSHDLSPDLRSNPTELVGYFRRFFHNAYWAGILKCDPDAKVIHEEVLSLEAGHPELFVVLSVPRTAKSFFAYRFFLDGDHQVILFIESHADQFIVEPVKVMGNLMDEMRAGYRQEPVASIASPPMAVQGDPAPSARIELAPDELRNQEEGDYYLHLENFPKERKFHLYLKRFYEEGLGTMTSTMWLDSEGNIQVEGKNKSVQRLSIPRLGFFPGEQIDYAVLFDDGTVISEGSFVPRPMQKTSKQGTFSLEAQLLMLYPTTTYQLILKGLEDQEVVRYTSVSEDEIIDCDYRHAPKNFHTYAPAVIGCKGGKSTVKITRKSGDSVLMSFLWHDAIMKPHDTECKTGIEAPEFSTYRPN